LLSTTKQKGTGLGLSIVSRVVETHHGKVRVLSRPGHGAAFIVSLPA
jgi:signal transduction histidine kinase